MMKRTLCVAALCPALMMIGGCANFGFNFSDDKVQYESSSTRANLEVPPDLTNIPLDNRYDVPMRNKGFVSANEEAARAQLAGEVKADVGTIVQRTVVSRVMRDGNERWLRVNVEADKLWSVVQDFWGDVGLSIQRQDAKTGYIETNWAENKAKLPQDIIRGTIGKVLDFAYSTGERDQYRCRVERNEDGTTDVFVTHRSMIEVVTGADKESTMWQPGPADPTLEAEMLQRLALAIDAEFNPEFEPLKKEDAAKTLDVTKLDALSTVVKNDAGQVEAVLVNQPFDRAWRTVNLVIDRMGFELLDRDRTAGYFRVRYLDPAYEMKVKESRGLLSNIFGNDEEIQAPEYRIQLEDEGAKSRLVVLNGEGGEDETGSASTILTLLGEQLR